LTTPFWSFDTVRCCCSTGGAICFPVCLASPTRACRLAIHAACVSSFRVCRSDCIDCQILEIHPPRANKQVQTLFIPQARSLHPLGAFLFAAASYAALSYSRAHHLYDVYHPTTTTASTTIQHHSLSHVLHSIRDREPGLRVPDGSAPPPQVPHTRDGSRAGLHRRDPRRCALELQDERG
jgi:hypothetical protein